MPWLRAAPILFLSTQLVPLPEAEKMRTAILKDFPQPVDFEPYDQRAVFDEKVIALAGARGEASSLEVSRRTFSVCTEWVPLPAWKG